MVFLLSPSIILCYTIIYLYYYPQLPEIIVGHRDLAGKIDGYTEKNFIWVPIVFNIVIVGAIGYLLKRPETLNYPDDIADKNRESAYFKMQIFLAITAIITSALFSLVIFDAIGFLKSANAFYFIAYFFLTVIAIPLLILKARI